MGVVDFARGAPASRPRTGAMLGFGHSADAATVTSGTSASATATGVGAGACVGAGVGSPLALAVAAFVATPACSLVAARVSGGPGVVGFDRVVSSTPPTERPATVSTPATASTNFVRPLLEGRMGGGASDGTKGVGRELRPAVVDRPAFWVFAMPIAGATAGPIAGATSGNVVAT